MGLSALWLWAGISMALAGDWREQPIETQVNTDFTAWTPGKQHWRLGVMGIEDGLLSNVSIGIPVTALYIFGVPNFGAKVTAIQTPRFDASIQGSVFTHSTKGFSMIPNGYLTFYHDLSANIFYSRYGKSSSPTF